MATTRRWNRVWLALVSNAKPRIFPTMQCLASSNVGNGESVLGLCHDIENAYGFAVECLHRDEPNALFQTNLVVVLNRPLCRLTQDNPTNATFKFLAMRVVATVYITRNAPTPTDWSSKYFLIAPSTTVAGACHLATTINRENLLLLLCLLVC